MTKLDNEIRHLLFGPDGNRRYAKEHGISFEEAYDITAKKIIDIIRWCFVDHPIDELSFALILDYNLNREDTHIIAGLNAAKNFFQYVSESDLLREFNLQLRTVGDLRSLFERYDINTADLDTVLEEGRTNQGKRVNILAPYSGSEELRRAWILCIKDYAEISLENLALRCSIPPVTHAIRTGQPSGIVRLSAYYPGIEQARILSTPTYPQDFTRKELDSMINIFLTLKDSYDKL